MSEALDVVGWNPVTGTADGPAPSSGFDLSGMLGGVGSFFGGPVGGLIGSVVGGLFGKSSGESSAKKAYKRQLAMMKYQMDWQERMANTQHQRGVADLRAAGLNPILSATKGPGAMPGGVSAPLPPDESKAVSERTASALAVQRATAEIANIRAQTAKTEQETKVGIQTEALVNAQHNQAQAQASWLYQQGIESEARIPTYSQNVRESELGRIPHLIAQAAQSNQQVRESIVARIPHYLASARALAQGERTDFERMNLLVKQIDAAEEILKGQKLEGQIDETQFGEAMRYLRRLSTSITGLGSNGKDLADLFAKK